jgi:peroxiredoxin
MFAHERSLVQKFAGRPFVLLGVNADESVERLRQTQTRYGLTWRSWWDADGSLARVWDVDRFPTLFLIDHRGTVRYRHAGTPDPERLQRQVEQLVREAAEN